MSAVCWLTIVVGPSFEAVQSWYRRASAARSFLRWAGGKWYALPQFSHLIPPFSGRYIEPMLGSGAVFFHLARERAGTMEAWLGDINRQLIDCFVAVRDTPEEMADQLEELAGEYFASSDRDSLYYRYREEYNQSLPKPEPALFLFLNRTCWNGLYRVNASGGFNVPHGGTKPPSFPSRDDLLNSSAALSQARLRNFDWQSTISQARPGDFVYLDPPYYSDTVRDSAKYSRDDFGLESHIRVAKAVKSLSDRGIDFILSNSGEPEMIDLYRGLDLTVRRIDVRRSISSDVSTRRNRAPELIVRPQHSPDEYQLELGNHVDIDAETPDSDVKILDDLGAIRF